MNRSFVITLFIGIIIGIATCMIILPISTTTTVISGNTLKALITAHEQFSKASRITLDGLKIPANEIQYTERYNISITDLGDSTNFHYTLKDTDILGGDTQIKVTHKSFIITEIKRGK